MGREPYADVEGTLLVVAYLGALRESTGDTQLGQWASEQATSDLRGIFPADDPHTPTAEPRARWSTTAARVAAAAAHSAGAESSGSKLIELTSTLAEAFQIWDDFYSLPEDVANGRRTTITSAIADSAGFADTDVDPLQMLGAAVATHALEQALASASDLLARSQRMANELSLPIIAGYLADVAEADLERTGKATEPRSAGPAPGSPFARSVVLPPRPLDDARDMAVRSLLADPTFRESWEMHREGMLGAPEVASRFPAGLVLEILASCGVKLTSAIDAFSTWTEDNEFRYYDHPSSDPDSDTLGVVLRLQRYRSRHELSPAVIKAVACVERLTSERRDIPVWLTPCAPGGESRATLRLGEGCATVVAHLLVGLIDTGLLSESISSALDRLLARIAAVGLGANVNYPPLYALAVYLRLLNSLGGGSGTYASAPGAQQALSVEVGRLKDWPTRSAQEAALACIAARAAQRDDLISPAWVATILDQQRFDGTWPGETFASAPNRGRRATGYSSVTLTTALCYDALTGEAGQSQRRSR